MQFFSTRDQNRKVTSSQAIAQGLSDEGGLFVPESFPQVDVKSSVRAGLPRAGSRRCAGVPDRLRPRFPDRRYPQHLRRCFRR